MFNNKEKTKIAVKDTDALQAKFMAVAKECNDQLEGFYQSIVFNDKMLSGIMLHGSFEVHIGKRSATNDVISQMPATAAFIEKMQSIGVDVSKVFHNDYSEMIFVATLGAKTYQQITPVAQLQHKEAEEKTLGVPAQNIKTPELAPIK